MTYADNCTGNSVIDRGSITYGGYQPGVYTDEVYAQRFVPTSKCLDYVTLRLRKIVNQDVVVEIRNDYNGSPTTPIGSGYLGRYQIPHASISTSFENINIPFNIIFSSLTPKWIVIVSKLYDPNYYDGTLLFDIDGDTFLTEDNIEYVAYNCGTCPPPENAWKHQKKVKFYYKTYKKTYTEPPTPPTCNFTVT